MIKKALFTLSIFCLSSQTLWAEEVKKNSYPEFGILAGMFLQPSIGY